MIIGTTPTFTLKLKRTTYADLSTASNIYVTMKQGNNILTKSVPDIVLVDGRTVQFTLTQAESLNLVLDKNVEVQLNWIYNVGNDIRRAATKVVTINLEKQLLRQELPKQELPNV